MTKQEIYEKQNKAFREGKVLFNTCEGVMEASIENLTKQDTQGLLYDLNRDIATVVTIFDENMLLNELALINVLKYLHNKVNDK